MLECDAQGHDVATQRAGGAEEEAIAALLPKKPAAQESHRLHAGPDYAADRPLPGPLPPLPRDWRTCFWHSADLPTASFAILHCLRKPSEERRPEVRSQMDAVSEANIWWDLACA